eukprot:14020811-Alexandrium_andersonii.AAC.1
MAGRRAPEMASGELQLFFERLWGIRFQEFLVRASAELSPTEYSSLFRDLGLAKVSIPSTLTIKCQHWE